MAYGDGGDAFNLESFIFFPILLFLYNRFPFFSFIYIVKKKKKKKKNFGYSYSNKDIIVCDMDLTYRA